MTMTLTCFFIGMTPAGVEAPAMCDGLTDRYCKNEDQGYLDHIVQFK